MEIEHGRKGTPSQVGDASTFSGRAMLDPLLEDAGGAVRINSVLFSPGGRTFWHSHAGGQVLIVASGHGMVETREGDRERLYASLPALHVCSHLADVGLKVDFEHVAFGLQIGLPLAFPV